MFAISPEMIDVINKLTELLITKKTFVLNSPILAHPGPGAAAVAAID